VGKPFDLVVIGAGSAGLVAANMAARLGARVALVEKTRPGGDCTWTGCVPSKALLKSAKLAHQMRTAERYGLAAVDPRVDLRDVMGHVHAVIDDVYSRETPDVLRAESIDVYLGAARFLDPNTIVAGEERVSGRNFLIATGAHPYVPQVDGLKDVDYLTYETVWQMDELPKRLLILGAGPIGSEMAQAFQRLGSQVTLFSSHDQILPRDDADAAHVVAEVFAAEGIDLRTNARAERVWRDGEGIHVAGGGAVAVGDALLLAAGRRPNVDGLDLEKAGVAYSAQGIQVSESLRTTQPHIYAAGDCTGGYQFTHYAGWQAFIAVRNAMFPGSSRGVAESVPWTTFTDPEIAQVGFTETGAREAFGDEVMTREWPMERVDRAVAEGSPAGFFKLVYKKDGMLLGVTVVAERAGEVIQEWALAIEQKLKAGDVANTIHVYPTYATAGQRLAADIRLEQVLGSSLWAIVRRMTGLDSRSNSADR
jgi:pyruvate/2-oxoglutarate dehydrogenase complex dihydrolipoamide dehydrogenase (E3) component